MIINLSWISILLLFYILYLFLTKQTEKYILFLMCALFFIVLFFVLDYQVSELRSDIVDFHSFTNRTEICDISSIHSECNITEFKYYDNDNKLVAQYYAIRDLQFDITGLVSLISYLAFGLFFILTIIHYVKKWGYIRE